LDDQKFKALMENIRRTPWKKKAYTKTDVLVIDEASMLHPLLFDMLNILMKELRGKETRHLPFGGLQVIISGDFFQLPPVVAKNSRNSYHSKDLGSHTVVNSSIFREEGNIPYLFDSRAWAELIHANMQTIELTNVFRQTDPVFLDILEQMRMGDCTAQTWEILKGCKLKQWPSDGIMVFNRISLIFSQHRFPPLE
jgi:ATP-dependent DNA helicase PIF1